jgi:hypothetical protein
MELTHGSETSAQHILTPGKYPKEHLQGSSVSETTTQTNYHPRLLSKNTLSAVISIYFYVYIAHQLLNTQ